jgi:hypothetical protein
MDLTTFTNQPEDIISLYGYYPEDAFRKTEDVLMEEWLRNYYLGK